MRSRRDQGRSWARRRSVTASRFRTARHVCRLSQQRAADVLGVSLRTIRNWEQGRTRIPYAAYKLMRILRGYELPGNAWANWRLQGDTLWTPEGYALRAWEFAWWGLLVAQARQFRASIARRRTRTTAPDSQPSSAAESRSQTQIRHGSAAGSPGLVHSVTSHSRNRLFGACQPETRIRARLLMIEARSTFPVPSSRLGRRTQHHRHHRPRGFLPLVAPSTHSEGIR